MTSMTMQQVASLGFFDDSEQRTAAESRLLNEAGWRGAC